MGWKEISLSLFFLLLLAESSGGSAEMRLINLGAGQSLLYSWTISSASVFVLVALVLSMYLIFEHLSAYNQPEVHSHIPFNFRNFSFFVCINFGPKFLIALFIS